VEALNLLAQIKLRQHCLDDAYLAQCNALARQPDEPRQYVLLSAILEKMGRTLEAHTAVAQVKRLEDLARQNKELLN
jgi:Flp pilus assembly protein TadD